MPGHSGLSSECCTDGVLSVALPTAGDNLNICQVPQKRIIGTTSIFPFNKCMQEMSLSFYLAVQNTGKESGGVVF